MNHKLILLAGTHLATLGLGYGVAPRELLDTEVRQSGFFKADTMEVLSATVGSLRSESKLLVYSYKGDARVWPTTRCSPRWRWGREDVAEQVEPPRTSRASSRGVRARLPSHFFRRGGPGAKAEGRVSEAGRGVGAAAAGGRPVVLG